MLVEALEWAQSTRSVPDEWTERTERIAESPSKTFTVALGNALLAKATNEAIDPLALKSTSNERSYSARTLAHNVLVPASIQFGFDLRATGREPLNNQPFFRYDRIDAMDRVHSGARASHAELVEFLSEADQLSADKALAALAAFLRVRLEAAAAVEAIDLRGATLGLHDIIEVTTSFITEDPEEGKRGQAFVAAAFDLVFLSVRTSRVYDPSRHYPGDVQALEGVHAIFAAEVRQKVVSAEEAVIFASSLRGKAVPRGAVVTLHPAQPPLPREQIQTEAEQRHGVLLTVMNGVSEVLLGALSWSQGPLEVLLSEFPQRMLERLEELEVSREGIAAWVAAVEPAD